MTANRIIQHIFQQPALSQVTEAALDQLVAEYPYFTTARLLLARKNYEHYPSLHAPAVKKAQLYSDNPHYFYQFVTGELEKAAVVEAPAPVQPEPQPAPAFTYQETDARVETDTATEAGQPEEEPADTYTTAIQDIDLPAGEEEPATMEAVTAAPEETEPAAGKVPATWEATLPEPEAPVEETFSFSEAIAGTPTEDAVQEEETQEEEAPVADEAPAAAPEIPATPVFVFEDAPSAPAEAFPAPGTEDDITTNTKETETEAAAAPAPGTAEEEPIRIFPLDIPEKEETTLTFQPLYTDDYFAYKRLKEPENAEEMNAKGKAEMRSFTDWLREMKQSFSHRASKDWYQQQLHRLYEDDEPEVSEAVEKMAMESITLNDDIVSETLAEIWARQQQYQTAIQIYQKLSLLNPDKSAYFAQKIQELQMQQLQQSETDKN
ncbi:hypothetical protein [Chitinophaga japonensis]|uniref:Tetratricopeptide repeat protein n=1 Tax=Chitinophaga japonensis TaxID=104662 RepID=A0A562T5S1_CHIJA|nr:hypothetical protein [Chitinophaga japonensis]TWI88887.1 hypothetical protein LX66_2975 [Chitinophaga japonensis]